MRYNNLLPRGCALAVALWLTTTPTPAAADPCDHVAMDRSSPAVVESIAQTLSDTLSADSTPDLKALQATLSPHLTALGRLAGSLRGSGDATLTTAGDHLRAAVKRLKAATSRADLAAASDDLKRGLSTLRATCPTLP